MGALVPWLGGGVLGLVGVIAALWWRYKLAKAEGQVKALGLEKTAIILERDKLDANYTNQVKRHIDEMAGKEKELNVYKERETHLRELVGKCSDPVVLSQRLGMLFPTEAEDGGEGSGEAGPRKVSDR